MKRHPHLKSAGHRLAVALLALLGSLAFAAPAGAFTPPEVFVRQTFANSIDHTPQGDWIPVAAAPTLNWLGGYEIGYRFQDAPGSGSPQRSALEIIQVPDGQPTQPHNTPFCSGGSGTPGTIVPVGTAIQFEGSGTYGVRVSVGPPSGGQNACMSGSGSASNNGSFTVDAPVAPAVRGSPLVFRSLGLTDNSFVGVEAPAPPGGDADTRCARGATVQQDGSVTGPLVVPKPDPDNRDDIRSRIEEADFERPGAWTCVARGYVRGYDENLDDKVFGTPWSAPIQLDVRSDFARTRAVLSKVSSTRPSVRVTAQFAEAADGGTGKLALRRLVRCKGKKPVFKSAGTFKGKFDSKGRATVKVRRPAVGYYVGELSFTGTRFYTKSTDPLPLLLAVLKNRKLSFVPRDFFPQCPNFP